MSEKSASGSHGGRQALLVDCTGCGNQMSVEATACPKCGHPNRTPTSYLRWWLAAVAALLVVVYASKHLEDGFSLKRVLGDAAPAGLYKSIAPVVEREAEQPKLKQHEESSNNRTAATTSARVAGASPRFCVELAEDIAHERNQTGPYKPSRPTPMSSYEPDASDDPEIAARKAQSRERWEETYRKINESAIWYGHQARAISINGCNLSKKPGAQLAMTQEQIINGSSWGSPNKVNRTTTATETREQWVYNFYLNGYLYFTNGRLTAIQN